MYHATCRFDETLGSSGSRRSSFAATTLDDLESAIAWLSREMSVCFSRALRELCGCVRLGALKLLGPLKLLGALKLLGPLKLLGVTASDNLLCSLVVRILHHE